MCVLFYFFGLFGVFVLFLDDQKWKMYEFVVLFADSVAI
jgi:hypothetical protein